jgi:hypothetical protein
LKKLVGYIKKLLTLWEFRGIFRPKKEEEISRGINCIIRSSTMAISRFILVSLSEVGLAG